MSDSSAEKKNSSKRIAELSIATQSDIADIDKCNRALLKENYDVSFYNTILSTSLSCSFVLRVEKKSEENPQSNTIEAPKPLTSDENVSPAPPAPPTTVDDEKIPELTTAAASSSGDQVKVSPEPLKNSEFAGYVLAVINYDKKQQVTCHIVSLGVYPQFRRQGFARVLMQSVEAFVAQRHPDVHHLALHVRKHNKIAYNLYCKLQYNRTKVVKGYYSDPKEDAYEMKKYLSPPQQQRAPQNQIEQKDDSEVGRVGV